LVVVLITVMIQGLKPARVRRIREALQIDSRTLKRWRQWPWDNQHRTTRAVCPQCQTSYIWSSKGRKATAVVLALKCDYRNFLKSPPMWSSQQLPGHGRYMKVLTRLKEAGNQ
jgi:hypothetical protein